MKNFKKVLAATAALTIGISSVSVFAMPTNEFDNGMEKGINYFNRGMYYEARDEFQWFCDANWGTMNPGQQQYALDYLDGAKANILDAYNGRYTGGGFQVPGEEYKIGVWTAIISNVTSKSMNLDFGQSESDYYIRDMTLSRNSNGSYYGVGYSDWGTSYITVWLETPHRISLTVSGAADTPGTELLYK